MRRRRPEVHYPHKVTIRRRKADPARTAGGQVDWTADANYDDAFSAKARVLRQDGRQFFQLQATFTDIGHVLAVPSSTNSRTITAADRVSYAGRLWDILAAFDVDENGTEVMIVCKGAD